MTLVPSESPISEILLSILRLKGSGYPCGVLCGLAAELDQDSLNTLAARNTALLTAEGLSLITLTRLSTARGLQVPDSPVQVRWVERFAAHRD